MYNDKIISISQATLECPTHENDDSVVLLNYSFRVTRRKTTVILEV